MEVEATTTAALATGADTVVVGVFEGEPVAHDTAAGTLQRLLDRGESKSALAHLATAHSDNQRVILVGLGDRAGFEAERARVAAAAAHRRGQEIGTRTLCWEIPHHVDDSIVAGLVEGTLLAAYRFDRYRPEPDKPALDMLLLSAHHDVEGVVATAHIIVSAQNRARELGNTPANDLPPPALARYAQELAQRHGLHARVLDERAISELGMGAFAAVAQGSEQEARLIELEYEGAAASTAPRVGMVGKAVTFDSGGLSIKPATSMFEMKYDMCGGAAVIEAVAALAELKAPVRALGVVGATENLPSGTAVKPGDVVKALDGTTIEVTNTDAEGRLLLADCLSYARRQGCDRLLDVATLTGGIRTALGPVYAGMTSNHDELAGYVTASSRRTGELVWRLPLHGEYARMIKGRHSQLINSPERRVATPIVAAELLHHFAGEVPWVHLDIAGTAYNVKRDYFAEAGATGFGVRLLVDVARHLARGEPA